MKIKTMSLFFVGILVASYAYAGEQVKWIGEVKDDSSGHTTQHWHDLKFKEKATGNEFAIVDSPELVEFHHKTNRNYLVEIEGEKTAKFLFWGGNLIVKKFKVLEATTGVIPHGEPEKRKDSNVRK